MSQPDSTSSLWRSSSAPKAHKRKRLAKACDACHRSKRRCDGTSPCANCDFAGKTCTYTDPTGRAVAPPRFRPETAPPEDNVNAGWNYSVPTTSSSYSHSSALHPVEPSLGAQLNPIFALQSSSPLDPDLTRELVNIFFAHNQPYGLMFHRPTFQYNLARNAVPHYLLNAIFSVAAPLSAQPRLRTTPSWHAGERFFQASCSILFNQAGSLACKPCVEVAQALCLLQAHELVMHRPDDRYLRLAFRTLDEMGVPSLDQKAHTPFEYESVDMWISRESCRRTFWYIHMIELLSSAFAQRTLSVSQLDLRVHLPVNEACFELATPSTSPNELLAFSNPPRENSSEFGQLLRVTSIYSGIMNSLTEKDKLLRRNDPRAHQVSITDQEQSLRVWLQTLPNHLLLNEENLHIQLSSMDSGASSSGWCYAYMHALAECSVLAMYEFASLGDPEVTHASREQKALENLLMILDALGPRGRVNLMMATLLLAVGKHCAVEHPHVASWFPAYERMWGVSLEQLLDQVFRNAWCTIGTGDSYSDAPRVASGGSPDSSSNTSVAKDTGGTTTRSLHDTPRLSIGLRSRSSPVFLNRTSGSATAREVTPTPAGSNSWVAGNGSAIHQWDRDSVHGYGQPDRTRRSQSQQPAPAREPPRYQRTSRQPSINDPILQYQDEHNSPIQTGHGQAEHLPRRDVRSISSLTSTSSSVPSSNFNPAGRYQGPGPSPSDLDATRHLQAHPFVLPSLRASFPDSVPAIRAPSRRTPPQFTSEQPSQPPLKSRLGESGRQHKSGVRVPGEDEREGSGEDAEGEDDAEVDTILGSTENGNGRATSKRQPQPARMPVGMAWLDPK